jgi:hypothetical protein
MASSERERGDLAGADALHHTLTATLIDNRTDHHLNPTTGFHQ